MAQFYLCILMESLSMFKLPSTLPQRGLDCHCGLSAIQRFRIGLPNPQRKKATQWVASRLN